MRSFRTVLTLLLWGFAIIPVTWLAYNQIHHSKEQVITLNKQQLMLDTNRKLAILRSVLDNSFSDLDAIASDGSIITSSTVDILSVKVIKELQSFLDNNLVFKNIMILDQNLFQVEAIPNSALAIDLTPFTPQLNAIFNDKETISEPNVRMLIVPKAAESKELLFALVRPILRPKESLTNPFELTGVLFSTIPLSDLVSKLLTELGASGESQISIYKNKQLLYRNRLIPLNENQIFYQASFSVGNNQPFSIEVAMDLSNQLTFFALMTKEKKSLLYTIALLAIILLSTSYIIRRLIAPINDLKQLTQQITESDWKNSLPISINSTTDYKEFFELKSLLQSMSHALNEQFVALSDKNEQLKSLTDALQKSVNQSDRQNDILQNLLDYNLFARREEDIEIIGCLTLGLAYIILGHAIGLIIYRSEHQKGFKSIDNANKQFLLDIEHLGKLHLDLNEISQMNKNSTSYHITAIKQESKCFGYIVTEKVDMASFTARSLDIFVASLQSRLQELQFKSELSRLANTDSLTNLYNRHYLDKTLVEYKTKYQENNEDFAVMLVDINGLKTVNDNLGHNIGDILIKKIADFLTDSFRASDVIARVGGDEFIILLTCVDSTFCQSLSQRLMSQIKSEVLLHENNIISLSFSCGYACTDIDPINEMIEIADKRMYIEKNASNTKNDYSI